ncbi:MAG: hypothetical protein H6728_14235 [Myxococcales bacterium]|nr:hypothetical protein [Myxococcales bacterium]MCB9644231.1 hypothetical protein [Myxococcales bacterium]
MKLRPAQRFLIFLTLLTCFVMSALYLKTYFRARNVFYRAEHLLKKKQLRPAIRSYGRVIRWYTPGSRYVERSIQRILRLAQLSFEQGDWELALFAYQHLYNALSAIRGLYQPFPQETAQCRHQEAILLALLPSPNMPSTTEREALHQHLRSLLQREHAPSPILSALSLFFFLCFSCAITVSLWQWALLQPKQRKLLALIATESAIFWLFFLHIA